MARRKKPRAARESGSTPRRPLTARSAWSEDWVMALVPSPAPPGGSAPDLARAGPAPPMGRPAASARPRPSSRQRRAERAGAAATGAEHEADDLGHGLIVLPR